MMQQEGYRSASSSNEYARESSSRAASSIAIDTLATASRDPLLGSDGRSAALLLTGVDGRPNTYGLWFVCGALAISSLVRSNVIASVHFVLFLIGVLALGTRRRTQVDGVDKPSSAVLTYSGSVTLLAFLTCIGHAVCTICASADPTQRAAMYGPNPYDHRAGYALNIIGFVWLGGDRASLAFVGYALPDIALFLLSGLACVNEAAKVELKLYRCCCSARCSTLSALRLPFCNILLGVLLLGASVAAPSLLVLPNLVVFVGALLWWAFRPRPHARVCCGRDNALGLVGCTPVAAALLLWNVAAICAVHLFQVVLTFSSSDARDAMRSDAWRLGGFAALPHMDWRPDEGAAAADAADAALWPAAALALLAQLSLVVYLARSLRTPRGGAPQNAPRCASRALATLAKLVASDLRPLPLCAVLCLAWATTVPSLLTLPILVWAIVALVLPLTAAARWVGVVSAIHGADAYTVRNAKGEAREGVARRALRRVRSPAAHSAGLLIVPGTGVFLFTVTF